MSAKITLRLSDVEYLSTVYDYIRVYRSRTGRLDHYYDITSEDGVTAASFLASIQGPYTYFLTHHEPLTFEVDGTSIEVTLSDTTVDLIVTAINNAADLPVASKVMVGLKEYLKLQSPTSGPAGSLKLVSGPWDIFGWVEGDMVYGTLASIVLDPYTPIYNFVDTTGDSSDWYFFRLWNHTDSEAGPDSDYMQGNIQAVTTVTCTAKIAWTNGDAAEGLTISFSCKTGMITDDGILAGLSDTVTTITSKNGVATALLVPGTVVTAVIHGTPMAREFTVPATDFDLWDYFGTDDRFDIVVPIKRFVIRRTV